MASSEPVSPMSGTITEAGIGAVPPKKLLNLYRLVLPAKRGSPRPANCASGCHELGPTAQPCEIWVHSESWVDCVNDERSVARRPKRRSLSTGLSKVYLASMRAVFILAVATSLCTWVKPQ